MVSKGQPRLSAESKFFPWRAERKYSVMADLGKFKTIVVSTAIVVFGSCVTFWSAVDETSMSQNLAMLFLV
jgi:hypothetical protein